jgi:hypothetical protein
MNIVIVYGSDSLQGCHAPEAPAWGGRLEAVAMRDFPELDCHLSALRLPGTCPLKSASAACDDIGKGMDVSDSSADVALQISASGADNGPSVTASKESAIKRVSYAHGRAAIVQARTSSKRSS